MNAKIIGIFTLLLALCIYMAIAVPDSFLTGNNIENLLRRTAMYGVLGIGVAFVIITAGIDLSIGSIVCLSACFLAMFLHVDYKPFDGRSILAVRGAEAQILLSGTTEDFKAGDRIRYYGGRRARNALLTITDVSAERHEINGRFVAATSIRVSQPLSADDDTGVIARVNTVTSFSQEEEDKPASITLAGTYDRIAARDRVTLVHPVSGLKELKIASAKVADGQTVLTLARDLGGDFNADWLAVPLERRQRMPIVAAIAAVLGIALVLGTIHGLLITKLKIQPFVVTLCGLLFYRGISRWMVADQVQGFGDEYVHSLSPLASGKMMLTDNFGIPYAFFIMTALAIIAAVFLNKTIWGRYMLALGRNEEAARYSGINTGRITILAYVICTTMAALGGMLFALDSNSVSPSSFGNFFELYAIAAAVLGGCSLRGGEGGILGVVIGTALMQVLYNLIVLMQISDKLEFAIIGAVILGGVVVDELVKRYAARRRAIKQTQTN